MYKGQYREYATLRALRAPLHFHLSFSSYWYTFYLLIYWLVYSTIYFSTSLVTVRTKTTIENKTSETTERHKHSLYCLGVATIWVIFFSFYSTKIYITTGAYILLISINNSIFTCLDSYVRLRHLQQNRITDLSRIVKSGIGHVFQM